MEEILKNLIGKQIDVNCGNSTSFRGDVIEIRSGVLTVKNEDGVLSHIAVDKISAVSEVNDSHNRPGFIG